MKGKYFRSNVIGFGTPTGTITDTTKIKVTGTIAWYKDYSAAGAAYRLVGASTWTHKAAQSLNVNVTTPSLKPGATYEVALYLKRGTLYDYSPAIEVTIPSPEFATPAGSVTEDNKIEITGAITWAASYDATGAAYRVHGTENWTKVAGSGLEVDVTTPELTADETYDVATYMTIDEDTFYSSAVEVNIPAPTPTPGPDPEPEPENNENGGN